MNYLLLSAFTALSLTTLANANASSKPTLTIATGTSEGDEPVAHVCLKNRTGNQTVRLWTTWNMGDKVERVTLEPGAHVMYSLSGLGAMEPATLSVQFRHRPGRLGTITRSVSGRFLNHRSDDCDMIRDVWIVRYPIETGGERIDLFSL